MIMDLFDKRTDKDKLWAWMREQKLFSSVDLSKYNASNFTLRAGRTAREWSERKNGKEPRLLRLSTQKKLFMNLIKDGNANIAYYELNPKWGGENVSNL